MRCSSVKGYPFPHCAGPTRNGRPHSPPTPQKHVARFWKYVRNMDTHADGYMCTFRSRIWCGERRRLLAQNRTKMLQARQWTDFTCYKRHDTAYKYQLARSSLVCGMGSAIPISLMRSPRAWPQVMWTIKNACTWTICKFRFYLNITFHFALCILKAIKLASMRCLCNSCVCWWHWCAYALHYEQNIVVEYVEQWKPILRKCVHVPSSIGAQRPYAVHR